MTLKYSFFLLVVAVSNVHGFLVDGGVAPVDVDDSSMELIVAAKKSPNITRSVTFKLFSSNIEESQNLQNIEWTWRANISDVDVPHVHVSNSQTLHDPHIMAETFDFSWPGGGSLYTSLNGSSSPFCVTTLADLAAPANVSNLYTNSNTNSTDCTSVLGQNCVNAIAGSLKSPNGNTCNSPDQSWSALPECADTLGYALSLSPGRRDSLSTVNLNGNGTSPSFGNVAQQSGQEFWAPMTGGFDGKNTSEFLRLSTGLKVVAFKATIPTGTHKVDTSQVLCMRVNASTLEDQVPGIGGNGSSGGGSDMPPNGGERAATLGWSIMVSLIAIVLACIL
ncbi:hypothetical protein GQ53DRAFT_758932 [Thozetella sp. PMI_491]|nr:hypothetical protein GQ53DRAFT_758932 [Thozetella sp. PMI_491]